MPTYIKTGYWDKKAKAPDGWLDLNLFCSTHGGGGTNIYNSDGTLTGNRQLNANNFDLEFFTVNRFIGYDSSNTNNQFYYDFANRQTDLGTFNGAYNQTFITIRDSQKTITLAAGFNIGTATSLTIDDTNQIIKTFNSGNDLGLKLDFANKVYQLGQIAGNNATTLKIDDAAAFPVQVSGTNVSQTTSGTASGKFLKIKVDGVDYVIELKNPS